VLTGGWFTTARDLLPSQSLQSLPRPPMDPALLLKAGELFQKFSGGEAVSSDKFSEFLGECELTGLPTSALGAFLESKENLERDTFFMFVQELFKQQEGQQQLGANGTVIEALEEPDRNKDVAPEDGDPEAGGDEDGGEQAKIEAALERLGGSTTPLKRNEGLAWFDGVKGRWFVSNPEGLFMYDPFSEMWRSTEDYRWTASPPASAFPVKDIGDLFGASGRNEETISPSPLGPSTVLASGTLLSPVGRDSAGNPFYTSAQIQFLLQQRAKERGGHSSRLQTSRMSRGPLPFLRPPPTTEFFPDGFARRMQRPEARRHYWYPKAEEVSNDSWRCLGTSGSSDHWDFCGRSITIERPRGQDCGGIRNSGDLANEAGEVEEEDAAQKKLLGGTTGGQEEEEEEVKAEGGPSTLSGGDAEEASSL